MVATFLTVVKRTPWLILMMGAVLYLVSPGWTEESLDTVVPSQSQGRSSTQSEGEPENLVFVQRNRDWDTSSWEEDEFSPSFSDETIREEDLPEKVLPDYEREGWPPVAENNPSSNNASPSSFPAYEYDERLLPFGERDNAFDRPSIPRATPPFMTRPFEWEKTPPTVIGIPPLPSLNSFSNRELVAFTFIKEGKEHFDRGEWELAQEQFERAVGLAPFLPYAYYFLGRIAVAGKDLQSALAFLQKAELLLPQTEQAWLGETTSVKGAIYEELEDYGQARKAYQRALRFQPENLKVLSALARLPEEEPQFSEAIP